MPSARSGARGTETAHASPHATPPSALRVPRASPSPQIQSTSRVTSLEGRAKGLGCKPDGMSKRADVCRHVVLPQEYRRRKPALKLEQRQKWRQNRRQNQRQNRRQNRRQKRRNRRRKAETSAGNQRQIPEKRQKSANFSQNCGANFGNWSASPLSAPGRQSGAQNSRAGGTDAHPC